MKFTIDKNILLENLNHVSKAITNKTIIPILNGIKFELTKEGLCLTATDSELVIQTFIENKDIKNITETGVIVIQSKYLLDIIRKMPENDINFEIIDGLKIKIYSNKNQYSLNCLEAKDFPNFKIEESKCSLILNNKDLKLAISQTSYAISLQESRPLLTGVNFKIYNNVLELIATDSYRLAKKILEFDGIIEEEKNIVIPGKNLIELAKILPEDETVKVDIFSNKIVFKTKNIIFQSNLLSGSYPNTSNLIPTDFEIILETNYKEFFDAVDRASLLTQNKEKNVIKMEIEKKTLKISSYATEIGKVEETVSIDQNKEQNLEISYSAKYMLEALRTLNNEKILILLNNEVKPIVIKTPTDENLIQLILPIKTY